MNVSLRNIELAALGRAVATLTVIAALQFVLVQNVLARGPVSVADLAEELSDAVVNISTSQTVSGQRTVPMPSLPEGSPFREFFEDFFNRQQQGDNKDKSPTRRVNSLGSGFVIDPSGIIVTNNHVIADADEIEVNFPDGSKLKAEVIGKDAKTDIALLRVKSDKPLKAVPLGDSNKIRVGDWVMAIGNPFGLGGTVTVGIVSARNRDINSGPYDDFIQTDAAINRGNSGGPLFNMDGQVIGINTAIISPTGGSIGIGFAIPAATAMSVIEQLREFGETRRGWLGVRIQTITDELAETLGLASSKGALVADVTEGGPAEAAGIQAGDVVVKFDGKAVPQMRDLPRIVAETLVGKTVDVVVIRKGKEENFQVKLGRLEDAEKSQTAAAKTESPAEVSKVESALGLKLSQLTKDLRTQFKINEKVKGVLITEVEQASSAAEKRIRAGDVIVEVGQEEVTKPDDVVKRVATLKSEGRKSVLLLLANKDGDLRFSALKLTSTE